MARENSGRGMMRKRQVFSIEKLFRRILHLTTGKYSKIIFQGGIDTDA